MRVHFLFFFNDTATTEIYTLSLHDALPISTRSSPARSTSASFGPAARSTSPRRRTTRCARSCARSSAWTRSEEHTSELQSRQYFVCRLLLEKKNICTVCLLGVIGSCISLPA